MLFCFWNLSASHVKNSDKPIGGEWDFKLKKAWEVGQMGDKLLVRVRGIGINEKGHIFLWESKQFKVFVFDTKGKLLREFGEGFGEGPGEVMDQWATSLYLTKDIAILHEVNTGRVHYFAHSGKFHQTRKVSKLELSHTLQTFIDKNSFLFTLSRKSKENRNFMGIYNLSTQTHRELTNILPNQPITVTDKNAGNLTLAYPDISTSIICTQQNGEHVYYGRNNKFTINALNLKTNQNTSFSITGRKGRKIPQGVKEKKLNYSNLDKRLKKKILKQTPNQTTLFNRIHVNKMGLIYVFIPNWQKENAFEIDIFSPKGKYLYHSIIQLPSQYSSIRNLTFNLNELYLTAEDEEQDLKLIKYTITPPQLK